jgi:hypothetical protein
MEAEKMAQITQVTLVDDLDGGEAAESVSFSLDGKTYEIDLSEKHAGRIERWGCGPPRPTSPIPEPVHGPIRRRPILGGLLNEYEAAA